MQARSSGITSPRRGLHRHPASSTAAAFYITLDDPVANRGTFANGINDEGQIVGA